MNNLIAIINGKSRLIDEDPWQIVDDYQGLVGSEQARSPILPLTAWLAHRRQENAAGDAPAQTGVLLDPEEDPQALSEWIGSVPLIALQFHSFRDGRAYSQAFLLRERMGFTGDLRAVGEVLRDQLAHMRHCGFTSFAVRSDKSAEDALKGLAGFDMIYARSVARPQPLFRRRGGE